MSAPPPQPSSQWKTFFFGGLLPIIAFTLIEEWQGPVWGTVAGLVFGAGELIYEKRTFGQVSSLTLTSNLFIFVLGGISIWTQEGIWFKLQPAFLLLAMAGWLFLTNLRGTPLLVGLVLKQNANAPPPLIEFLRSVNLRLGFFFLALTALSVWAALDWSTEAWAALKGIGAPILLFAYMGVEVLIFRLSLSRRSF